MSRVSILAALLGCALAGCADIQTRRRDWSAYDGPGAKYFHQEEAVLPQGIRDPAQPFNRGLFAVNDWLVTWIVSPIGTGWRFVFPKTVREHLGKAGKNLAFPTRALNQLFQGEAGQAGTETSRFLINTTVGLLGLFDPADSWGLEAPLAEDTGQTLQKAGWDDPAYLFLPLQGPSTTRDGVGLIGDVVTNIGYWISPFVGLFFQVNKGSDTVLVYEQLEATDPDLYRMARLAWSVLRGSQVEDFPIQETDGPAEQTLEAVFFRPSDPAFFRSGTNAEVEIPSTGKRLPFTYWLQDGQAPLLYIIPGLGAHRLSDQPLALASDALATGWSVVIISSALHPEFMALASTAPVPGYAPVDSHDVRVAFDAIDRQLSAEHPGRLGRRACTGISMGCFHAMYIAAEEQRLPDSGLLEFEIFGVGAPPVSLAYGVEALDGFYNTPLKWPADEREARIRATLQRVAALAGGSLRPGDPLPFSEDEARFLVGLSFRITLVDVLWASQERHDQQVLLTPRDPDDREPAYREMLDYSWMEYFYAFLLPWVQEQGLAESAEDALARCDLRSIEPWLKACTNLHVYMSDNDFLRRPEDVELLRRIFPPDRLRVTRGGGHLGNAWKSDEVSRIYAELKQDLEALPPRP
ncbi:MAG TPA: VacJ family lipoprotein [Planctomycetota bacterium]|nr:VacJ family lipoprotein [Planctomycetota bacterium]